MTKDFTEKVAWVKIQDRKMLFVRGKKHEKDGRKFYINPGGKIEPGESHHDALCREVKEELSLGLLPSTIKPARKAFAGLTPHGKPLTSYPYFADALGPIQVRNEITEYIWLGSSDGELTTPVGRDFLAWAKEANLID